MATGLVWHERYMWHDTSRAMGPFPAGGWLEPGEAAENAGTKRRLKNLLDVSRLTEQLVPVAPRPATVEEVLRVHTPGHVERIRTLSAAGGGDAGDGITALGAGSYEIALLSAGGAIAAVDAVLDGTVDNAYALVRPPGHHAVADSGMGFCLFNNCAIAAHHARGRGVSRLAIVDWDVHHGNGTQAAFYDDPAVLTISLHQDNCFPPGSGTLDENGRGAGEGANLNVPLPAGSGSPAYVAAFERVVLPALDRFRPELVLVASGLDANGMDPLARQLVDSDGFRRLTALVLDAAQRHAGGRLVLVHEGGYSQAVVPFCGLAVLEELSGVRTEVADPFAALIAMQAGPGVLPHQKAAIDRAAALVDRVPQA
jgi:acetoin utilization deacetylase AcuC-like enzyme